MEVEVQLGLGIGGVILQRKVRGLLVKEREMDSVHYTNHVNRCIETKIKLETR